MKIDKKLIKELVNNLDEFNLTELEYQDGTTKIKVSKASKSNVELAKPSTVMPSNKAVLSNNEEEGIRIKSPIIGTAYLASEPGGKKFVEVGDKVKKGQTIMIVEAMKTMNHVASTK
jgi:Biotin carboxyl carrier protein